VRGGKRRAQRPRRAEAAAQPAKMTLQELQQQSPAAAAAAAAQDEPQPPAAPVSPSAARRARARARFRAAVFAVLRHLSGASALADKASDVSPDAAEALLRRAASFGVSDPGCEHPPDKHPHRPVFHVMPVRGAPRAGVAERSIGEP
jgi:hypothetical protein